MQRPDTLYILTAAAVVLSLILGVAFLARAGLPSADVSARHAASRPVIKVSDFSPGEPEIVRMNSHWVIVWRRSEADKIRAASQNDPETWQFQYSKVWGQVDPVYADDANLTLNQEWFFALVDFSNPFQHLILGAGDYWGFLEGQYLLHFDLSGRLRKGTNGANLTIVEAAFVDDGEGILLQLDGRPQVTVWH
ncbi:MAG: hypothetical protein VX181_15785 [Pseudomonadota bacterium]|uniref:hypothetical protein n=1 Tax=Thalassovita sp. TaxID=1979401 RepID=UPI002AB26501|nr:hypothetical protein [Thalassovita sp.]MEC7962096.1 hypothetical protein [Pseudomonadota bacterium]MEC8042138.1 hypothetical protein [Pseudomonadota bacterium]